MSDSYARMAEGGQNTMGQSAFISTNFGDDDGLGMSSIMKSDDSLLNQNLIKFEE